MISSYITEIQPTKRARYGLGKDLDNITKLMGTEKFYISAQMVRKMGRYFQPGTRNSKATGSQSTILSTPYSTLESAKQALDTFNSRKRPEVSLKIIVGITIKTYI